MPASGRDHTAPASTLALPRRHAFAAGECGLWPGVRNPETRWHHWNGHQRTPYARAMQLCPSCGRETPEGFPRCANCGAELAVDAARQERKIVTVLFCDLVGFTSRAETMDPEDVRALLEPYHAHVRSELERFGGTVEKFIGDAVMAVLGAPIAHEDDPERAVRAALAIR